MADHIHGAPVMEIVSEGGAAGKGSERMPGAGETAGREDAARIPQDHASTFHLSANWRPPQMPTIISLDSWQWRMTWAMSCP